MRDPNREYDNTSLKVDRFWGVHRDYAAHYFRWGFVFRFVNKKSRILDLGCGTEAPMARVISRSNQLNAMPAWYEGVDMCKLGDSSAVIGRKVGWAHFRGNFNFAERWREIGGKFNLITCLEVVEHMKMVHVRKLLRGALELLAPGGLFVLSTPVFNGKMAANHINEMTVDTLQSELEYAGWSVERRFGTFMSDGDRKKCATPEESALCERLKEYYSGEVVATFLAPLYPDHSRNCVWMLRKDLL